MKLLLVALIGFHVASGAPPDSSRTIDKKKLRFLISGAAIGYTASMAGLYHLWYKNSEQQSFRFFNDNAEWKQIDKGGHFFSGFYLTHAAAKAIRWTGVSARRSDLYGALAGFAILVPVEVMDGFSDAYGASTGDLIADAAGPLLYLGQQSLWNEIRIHPKISFHETPYAARRPEILGENLAGRMLKDYNGHTFWLSVDADRFIRFPKWLNLAVGYGSEQMIYARDHQNREAGLSPFRQYYFSVDFDLTAIKTRSKAVKALLFLANIIKIPAPAIEFSRKKTVFHPFYF